MWRCGSGDTKPEIEVEVDVEHLVETVEHNFPGKRHSVSDMQGISGHAFSLRRKVDLIFSEVNGVNR